MTEHGSLKIGRRRLAAELRRLRELANLTGDDVGDRLGWSASKISRIELNRTEVKTGDLTKLLDLYSVGGPHRADLLALAEARRSKGWWEAYSDLIGADYAAYIELEAEAEVALCWSPLLVHGLLQTEDYARAVMESHLSWMPVIPAARFHRLVEVRLTRQQRVTADGSLALSVVLDESALLRNVGGPEVMRSQLQHLVDASGRPNVTLRVLPLAGTHPVGTGSFSLLTFPAVLGTGPASDVVYVEQLTHNDLYADEESTSHEYQLAFEQLTNNSLDPEASRALIGRVMRRTWP